MPAAARLQTRITASGTGADRASRTRQQLGTMIAACFTLQVVLVFLQPINWDEFRFLSDVHLLRRGQLVTTVQTFHAHFFPWLVVFGGEIEQITAARCVMLVLEAAITWMIYRCARRFVSAEAALLGALCYISTAFVMRNGASFRFDPPSTFLMMGAITILTTRRIGLAATACVGALTALAAMITIKSVFFVPTLAFIAWWRVNDAPNPARTAWQFAFGLLTGGIVLLLLYSFHSANVPAATLGLSEDVVSSSVRKTLGHARLFPQDATLVRSLLESPLNWLMMLGGALAAAAAAFRARDSVKRYEALALAAFALPLLTLVFYRNAFPYYYSFMLAPVAVLAALAAASPPARTRIALIGFVLSFTGAFHGVAAISPVKITQRATVEAVHAIFPQPVAYIDRCSMIATFPKQGFFMSSWGTEVYRDAGKPIMRETLLRARPAFLLANGPGLANALAGIDDGAGLLPEDAAILRDNFIAHWGAIWVAGKRLSVEPEGRPFEMLIAGRYTVESEAAVLIDGARRDPGEVVTLAAGRHVARAFSGGTTVTLRWGDHLKRPSAPAPKGLLFADF